MNEDYVPFALAKKLKEKGFKEECFAHYNDLGNLLLDKDYWKLDSRILAPTIGHVLKWLREEKKLFVLLNIDDKGWCYSIHSDLYWNECGSLVRSSYYAKSYFETYEEAALAGISYVLDNLI